MAVAAIGGGLLVEGTMKKIGMMAAAAVAALALSAGAGAQAQLQTPRGYQGPAGAVQQQIRGGVGESNTLGSLPFTGLDLALGVGAGLLLLMTGGAIRRLATKRV
jgi:hypothetical protein